MQSLYAQDDWKVTAESDAEPRSALGVWLAVLGAAQQHLELRSGLADGADDHAGSGGGQWDHAVLAAGGMYGKTLVNPDYKDFAPRVGFCLRG